ncbi:MAG: inositol monophosphatase, partial [Opitutales bacterium]|nr:inositol monophosphatase [Opitutales bacterium]
MSEFERAAQALHALGLVVRDCLRSEKRKPSNKRTAIAKVEASDIIYQIDTVSEAVILEWFSREWTDLPPVRLVMEGAESEGQLIYPTMDQSPEWICLIDPIDGTRGIMYDKRSAWFIAGIAPIAKNKEPSTEDIVVSVLVELPTSKAGYADSFYAIKGCGLDGVFGERIQLFTGEKGPLKPSPYQGTDITHGFFSFAKFFPEGRLTLTRLEIELIDSIHGLTESGSPVIFDDQYMSTGGQFYEILMGHDRAIIDARREVYMAEGLDNILTCHPYDIGAWLILEESGCIIERPDGGPLDFRVNTTEAVSWAAYANPQLAFHIRPVLKQLLKKLRKAS